jgi:hypothetical protein
MGWLQVSYSCRRLGTNSTVFRGVTQILFVHEYNFYTVMNII